VFDAAAAARFAASDEQAHLWLVPNPPFHPRGDFDLDPASGRLRRHADAGREPARAYSHTYANIALARPGLVQGLAPGVRAPLGPFLFAAADQGRLGGSVLAGEWHNVGSPAQLAALEGREPPGG
jgi:MurNAc alpha-1-phosphate uridylyltransferase